MPARDRFRTDRRAGSASGPRRSSSRRAINPYCDRIRNRVGDSGKSDSNHRRRRLAERVQFHSWDRSVASNAGKTRRARTLEIDQGLWSRESLSTGAQRGENAGPRSNRRSSARLRTRRRMPFQCVQLSTERRSGPPDQYDGYSIR
ncbi:hypothetical protein C485_05416 [Natrinema altunense JCM 12890]|uniref:Uncharacterized protein n=1 Tax=Natrinema altunense (strain JCM 12890 / CGMCC 1.3731 / AJ2) TaxID=1227494 RepID=L9ZSE3_NATA2|nr:hypothetical protein C485_05416 [Natrinema altunense JCM 12890]